MTNVGWLAGAEDFICKIADEAVAPWRQRETVPWSAWKTLKLKTDNAGIVWSCIFMAQEMMVAGVVHT